MKSYTLTDGHEPISHAEIDYLAELASSLPDAPIIVNIGAWIGVSTCTFLEARPDCLIYSVDVNQCEAEFENARRFGMDADRIIRLLGDSKAFGQVWNDIVNLDGTRAYPDPDMVFVDGDHWNARGDIDAWRDKIKPGGVMVFHDWMRECPPNNPGDVYAQVNEGMAGYEQIGQVERLIAFRV